MEIRRIRLDPHLRVGGDRIPAGAEHPLQVPERGNRHFRKRFHGRDVCALVVGDAMAMENHDIRGPRALALHVRPHVFGNVVGVDIAEDQVVDLADTDPQPRRVGVEQVMQRTVSLVVGAAIQRLAVTGLRRPNDIKTHARFVPAEIVAFDQIPRHLSGMFLLPVEEAALGTIDLDVPVGVERLERVVEDMPDLEMVREIQ